MNRLLEKKKKSWGGGGGGGHRDTWPQPFWPVKYVYLSYLPFVIEIVFAFTPSLYCSIILVYNSFVVLNVRIALEILEYWLLILRNVE